MRRVAYSMYDGSGYGVKDWADAGYKCYCFNYDGADHGDYEGVRIIHSNIEYVNVWIDSSFLVTFSPLLNQYPAPDIVLAFPPCTDLSASGARWFASKREKDPDFQVKAAYNAKLVETLADMYGVPWMVENPVGALSTLWRKPDFVFNPCAYGGYLPDDDKHPAFPDVYPPRDAYTKKTCIWHGNKFVQPLFRPVPLAGDDNPGWKKTGGKGARTKMIRSLTPRGFARAVFLANDRAITRTTLNRVLPD
ncbi:DNA cytosine methyltransferase [Escherichia coli]